MRISACEQHMATCAFPQITVETKPYANLLITAKRKRLKRARAESANKSLRVPLRRYSPSSPDSSGQSAVRNAFQGDIKMRQRLREAPTTRITLPSEFVGKVNGKCKQSERGREDGGAAAARREAIKQLVFVCRCLR